MKYIKGIIKIIIIIIILMIIFLLSFYYKNKGQEINENVIISNDNKNEINYSEVNSATAYFTAQSCVNQYLGYLNDKDKKSLYIMLDNEYINNFNINESNVLDYVEDISKTVTFKAKKMYVANKSDNIKVYYIKGILQEQITENDFDVINTIDNNFNITINLDLENMTFSVIPYGYGGMFYEK